MMDFSKPCSLCAAGLHDQCDSPAALPGGLCGCIANHADDTDVLRGFKKLKRRMCPKREAWVEGGWT